LVSLRKRCSDCYQIRRNRKLFILCRSHPRHKQRQKFSTDATQTRGTTRDVGGQEEEELVIHYGGGSQFSAITHLPPTTITSSPLAFPSFPFHGPALAFASRFNPSLDTGLGGISFSSWARNSNKYLAWIHAKKDTW